MSDGSYYVAMYNSAVHYLDGDVWEEIDNTLASSSASDSDDIAGVATSKGKHTIKFANNSNSSKLVAIKQGNFKISFNLVGANKSKGMTVTNPEAHSEDATELERLTVVKKAVSSVMYEDILDGVDLEYVVNGNNIKENIIVKEKSGEYVYQFDMKLDKLSAEQLDDGKIVLKDEKTDEVVYVISLPFMIDAAGKYSDKVTYSLEQVKNKEYRITVTADSEWMNDESRAFPVTIDPPITADSNYIEDASVVEVETDVNCGEDSVNFIGYEDVILDSDEFGIRYWYYTYLKISHLPAIPTESIITNAVITLYQEEVSDTPDTEEFSKGTIGVYPAAACWNEDDITFENQPGFTDSVLDYKLFVVDSTSEDYTESITWNITNITRSWYSKSTQNYGIVFALITSDEVNPYGTWATFYSSEYISQELRPTFTVTYRSAVGLENCYTYQTQSIGRAGTVYLNDYTSAYTVVRDDIYDSSTTLPFTLNHIYNSSQGKFDFTKTATGNYRYGNVINTADFSSMKLGKGWKLNVQESVVELQIGDSPCYVYTDSDGTEHYFHIAGEVEGTYNDEDGLDFTLTVTNAQSGSYTLTDKQDNQKIFVNNILSKIVDANGNTIKMIYNGENGVPLATGSVLQSIIRYNMGYEAQAETVATFSYDSDGYLTSVTDRAGRTTVYAYDNGSLVEITNPDGTKNVYGNWNSGYRVYDYEAKYGILYGLGSSSTSHPGIVFREYYFDESVEITQEMIDHGNYSDCIIAGKGVVVNNSYGDKVTYTEFRSVYYEDNYFLDEYENISTVYCFDETGRTISIYSCDNNGKVYGATTAEYVESDNAKKKNKIESIGVVGVVAQNLLKNSSAENDSHWTAFGVTNNRSTAKPRTGEYSLAVQMTSSVTEGGYKQTFTSSEGGTYTVSAYVNLSELTFNEGGSVYLKAENSETIYYGFNPATHGAYTYTKVTSTEGEGSGINYPETIIDIWHRISVTFEAEAGKEYSICLCVKNATGTAYFDDIQLEEGETPSTYNLLESLDTWTLGEGCQILNLIPWSQIKEKNIYFDSTNYAFNNMTATFTVPINKSANTTFHLSGWVYGSCTAKADDRIYGIVATIKYTNGESEDMLVSFNPYIFGQQFAHGIIAPTKTDLIVEEIVITLTYRYHIGYAYFYNIALTEDLAQTYTYDDEGNLVAVNKTDTSTISTAYDNLDNVIEKEQGNTNFTYTYYGEEDGVSNKHLLKTVTNDGVTMTYTYDSAGNVTGTVVTNIENNKTLSSSTSYINNGTLVGSVEDGNGISVTYGYNSRNLLTSVTNAANVTTHHTYNEQNDREISAYIEDIVSVNYNYLEGRLASIVRTGYIEGSETPQTQTYSFEYDLFGNTTKISVGDYTLVTYEYEDGYGNLIKTTYGNGNYIENVYDELDRIVEIKVNGETKYKYTYGGDGNLYSVEDVDNDTKTWYNYDSLGRLISSYQTIGEDVNSLYYYTYDDKSRATRLYYTISGTAGGVFEQIYSYAYDDTDDTLTSLTVQNGSSQNTISYAYDYLKRLSTKSYGNFTQTYNYKMLSETRTSTLIDEFKWTMGNTELRYNYTYDELGNIQRIYKNGVEELVYVYDEQGQLTGVADMANVKLSTYIYDSYGNIRKVYGTQQNGDNFEIVTEDMYSYTDPTWLDRLTAFNGVTITYDDAGNPLSYYNGNAYTLTWQNGRELATATKNGVTSSYKYNIDGQRIQKTVGNVVYDYYYADGLLVRQTWGNNYIDFIYDESGIFSFVYNGVQYYYIKNLQGDVVAIANSNGTILVEYAYDAWGDILSITGTEATTLGAVNPIRYRGYYFDTDTEFYYLNSRYYDPEIRRFINADEYASTGQGFIGYNMYAYCGNNSVNRIDSTGMFWKEIKDSLSKAWNGIKTWTANTFGAGTSTTATIAEIETPVIPDPSPITVKTGTKTTQTVSQCGDSSKPISVYANKDAQHPIKSSSVGININIVNFTLGLNIGLDDIGVSASLTNGNTTNNFGIKLNLSEFKVGFEGSTAIQLDNTTETTYTNASASGWLLVAAYILVTTGQYIQSPSYAY